MKGSEGDEEVEEGRKLPWAHCSAKHRGNLSRAVAAGCSKRGKEGMGLMPTKPLSEGITVLKEMLLKQLSSTLFFSFLV